MKKSLLIIILSILIVPSTVLASWWNPFSWKVFNKQPVPKIETIKTSTSIDKISTTTEDKTEIQRLRNEIEILKKQSKVQAGDTLMGNAATKSLSSPGASIKKINPTPTQFNFNVLTVDSYNSSIKLLDMQIKQLEIISSDADRYLDGIPSLINKMKIGAESFPQDREFWNLIIDIYTKHKDNIYNLKKIILNYISTIENYQNKLRDSIILVQDKNISLNEAQTIIKEVQSERDKIDNSVNAIKESYELSTSRFLEDKDAVSDTLESSIYNTQSTIKILESKIRTIPDYSPSTTNCSYYSYYGGGSLNCYSY